ncbi:MAG: preprotein translocase subunit SecG [Candidatus Obscuribacterales bacterium]|nr:preprotein translocase subunit SecG [Candidatus Obscuribacterales bacterium]
MNPWYIVLMCVEIILAVGVIFLILLHAPKGDGLGGIGGAATTFSGKRGAEAGLDKVTWFFVSSFMLVCVILGFGFVQP